MSKILLSGSAGVSADSNGKGAIGTMLLIPAKVTKQMWFLMSFLYIRKTILF